METDDLATTLAGVLDRFRAHQPALEAVLEASTYDRDVARFWRDFHEWFIVNAAQRAQRADPSLSSADAEARGTRSCG